MRDDRNMGVSQFEDVDVVFADVVDELFGDAVDPRELWDVVSKMNDVSEVHVQGAAQAAHRKRRNKLVMNTVGQGLNALAIGAGGHALLMAGRDERLAASTNKGARALAAPYKAWSKTKWAAKVGPKSNFGLKYAAPLAAGAVGLHTAELVGDSIAARALRDQRKASQSQETSIKKALDDIVAARRRGIITTDRAIEMSAIIVEKSAKYTADDIERQAETLVDHPLLPKKDKKVLKPMVAGAKTANTSFKKTVPKIQQTNQQIEGLEVDPTGIKKSAPELTWSGEISKMDTDKRQVFGWCSVTHIDGKPVIDLQGDYTPLEEIEKAAYTYVIESRKGGDMHRRVSKGSLFKTDEPLHTSDLVESFVVTPEKLVKMGLESDALPYGWWVGFKVNDEKQWEMVKNGERTGFSIHGSGRRVEKYLGE
jgi:hypothetical protein